MRKGRNYYVYTEDGWRTASREEWTAWAKAGKRGSINQIVGVFGSAKSRSWVMVSTGPSNRKNRAAGEWESRVWDEGEIDLVNPSYCCGSVEAIEAMHARALSNARQWRRNYVERPVHYSENILWLVGEEGYDPRYLAKNPDFAVDYFEEDPRDDD